MDRPTAGKRATLGLLPFYMRLRGYPVGVSALAAAAAWLLDVRPLLKLCVSALIIAALLFATVPVAIDPEFVGRDCFPASARWVRIGMSILFVSLCTWAAVGLLLLCMEIRVIDSVCFLVFGTVLALLWVAAGGGLWIYEYRSRQR